MNQSPEPSTNVLESLIHIPPYVWISLFLLVLLIISIVSITLIILFRDREIKTPIFSTAEKQQVQADTRELSDNQVRSAKMILDYIKTMFQREATNAFIDMDLMERSYLDLLFNYIMERLMWQYRIDIVRNHIVKKSDKDLEAYTEAKAQSYYMKVKTILCDYNREIPRFDLMKIMDGITEKDFYDLYYKAYDIARKLAVGY